MLYFAYGSNLNFEEMAHRCPSAKFIGYGVVSGYTLVFRYYLSVDKSNNSVLVGIWEITDPNDIKKLDYYEGYPTLYSKKNVECVMQNYEVVVGTMYVMNKNQYSYRKPSDSYLVRCIEGYLDCGIDYTQLIDAYNMVK